MVLGFGCYLLDGFLWGCLFCVCVLLLVRIDCGCMVSCCLLFCCLVLVGFRVLLLVILLGDGAVVLGFGLRGVVACLRLCARAGCLFVVCLGLCCSVALW